LAYLVEASGYQAEASAYQAVASACLVVQEALEEAWVDLAEVLAFQVLKCKGHAVTLTQPFSLAQEDAARVLE
jgi:hypothetical protein